MSEYFHALRVDLEKCRGHRSCMRRCPTQAIRVRQSKARISADLCIYCGDCISACAEGAILPIPDPVADISQFKYKIVIPSQVFYSQFDPSIHPYVIHRAFKKMGFDEVVDSGHCSIEIARAVSESVKNYKGRRPQIFSTCPSVHKLLQFRYPDLAELVMPMNTAREITAREIRRQYPKRLGIKAEDIGIIYVTSCAARIVAIKQPGGGVPSNFDGVLSIRDVYSLLLPHVTALKESFDERQVPEDFSFHPGWIKVGSVTRAAKVDNGLAVSGLDNVTRIFDDIETSRLRNVDFVEANSCMLGCIGAPFNVENPYVARANSFGQVKRYGSSVDPEDDQWKEKMEQGYYSRDYDVTPASPSYFDSDLETSIKRMKESERVFRKLPQIDCGCCGSPTCMSFAEDFSRGEAQLSDCIILATRKGGN